MNCDFNKNYAKLIKILMTRLWKIFIRIFLAVTQLNARFLTITKGKQRTMWDGALFVVGSRVEMTKQKIHDCD